MFERWIVLLFILSTFFATGCKHGWAPSKPEPSKPLQKHKAEPQKILINGVNIAEVLNRDKNDYTKLTEEELRVRNFLENRDLKGDAFLTEFKQIVGLEQLTGFASLIGRNLEDIRDSLVEGENIAEYELPKTNECYQALQEKREWHKNNGGVPAAFGKIVKYDVRQRQRDSSWTGRIDVCTWFGKKVYYVEIVFYIIPDDTIPDRALTAVEKLDGTFPDTLDSDILDALDLSKWNWKLHAKGGSFGFITARENDEDIDRSDDLFRIDQDDCFDMFFKDPPPEAPAGLPPEHDRCMGRCDGRIMNTAV